MKPLHRPLTGPSTSSSTPTLRNRIGYGFALLLACALAAFALPAMADDGGGSQPTAASWEPTIITALSDLAYAPDPDFNNGEYLLDALGTDQTQPGKYFVGQKVARMTDGSLVVAALVKYPGGNQTNGQWNLGLVHYNAAGTQRLPWSNGGTYAYGSNQYIVYPNAVAAYFSHIQNIKVVGDKILVAVNYSYANGNVDAVIVVFGTDGSFKTAAFPFGTAFNTAEFIGGIDTYSYIVTVVGRPPVTVTQVVAVGTRAPAAGGNGRALFRRYLLNDDGTLSGGTGEVAMDTHWCATTSRTCGPVGLAVVGSIGARIYVLIRSGFTSGSTTHECVTISRVDTDGVADTAWPSNTCLTSDDNPATAIQYNRAQAIVVKGGSTPTQDRLFVLAEIQRQCGNGVLVDYLNGYYGTSGKAIFGGTPGGVCPTITSIDYPIDMALSADQLAVVGFNKSVNGASTSYTGWVALLDPNATGPLSPLDFTDYPMTGGANYRDTALYGIVPTANGRFVVTGDARYPPSDTSVPENLRGKNSIATLGIAPASDTIFKNGFDRAGL